MTTPDDPEALLKPVDAARIVGLSAETLGRWAREGKLTCATTTGGHRRYRLSEIRQVMGDTPDPPPEDPEDRAVRLYEEGLSVRRVATRMGWKQTRTLRLLQQRTKMRDRVPRAPLAGKLADASERLTSTTQRVVDSDVEPDDVASLVSYLYDLAEHGHAIAGCAVDQAAAAKVDASAEQASTWMDVELYLSHAAALFDALTSFAGDSCRRIEGMDPQADPGHSPDARATKRNTSTPSS